MNEIYNFYKEYIQLEQVLRKGWLIRKIPVSHSEDDAHHTLQTILLADLIIKEYDLDINSLKVFEMLLIHEIGEILIGDISMIEKDYEEKLPKEIESVKKELSVLSSNLEKDYLSLWQEFSEKNTREAKFAFLIDKLDAVLKAKNYDEQLHTDKYFIEFYNHALGLLQDNEFKYILEDITA